MAMDLLWSDPSEFEDILGLQANQQRDPQKQNNIMTYGPDQVEKFLKANNLSIIVRAHQNVMDGIDRFAMAQLITLTSTSNYGGVHSNDAAFLVL